MPAPRKQAARRRPSKAHPAGARVPRGELVAAAHDRLRDLIVRGRLAPGAPIIETEIAALLGVRRSHLRAALLRLQHTGFVISSTIGTYSRSRVAPLTLGDVQELFAVIGALEGVAARNAANLPPAERSRLVVALRRINRELRPSARVTPADYHDLDGRFHALYVTGAGGARVRMLYDAIKPQADRYALMYTYALYDQITISAAEHDAIVEAIDDGDADAAQRAADANWRNAAERFRRSMDVAGERGNAVPA
ncbi:MAG: GntR family transcriptional regulator [Gemmatimonadota bacterium]|nr:GntR family transcriptional regulator [Gemmatimonadota bacterium]